MHWCFCQANMHAIRRDIVVLHLLYAKTGPCCTKALRSGSLLARMALSHRLCAEDAKSGAAVRLGAANGDVRNLKAGIPGVRRFAGT